jgi:hypothetical protein
MLRLVTTPLFDCLEKMREFEKLKTLYGQVAETYANMVTGDVQTLELGRILVGDGLHEFANWTEAIFLTKRDCLKSAHPFKGIPCWTLSNDPDPKEHLDGDELQIVEVLADPGDLAKFRATEFRTDVVSKPDARWKRAYAKRITYVTETPLPACSSVALIKEVLTKKVKKQDYFVEKLEQFSGLFRERIAAIAAGLPSPALEDRWAFCVVKVSTKPVIDMMGQVVTNDEKKKDPVLSFVAVVNRAWPTPVDAPDRVAVLARRIWVEMQNGIKVIEKAHKFVKPGPELVELFTTYKMEILNSW